MIQGLTQAENELLEHLAIRPLKEMGCEVWVFGSRARGDHRKFSDIDLLFKLPVGQTLPHGFVSELHEALEESNLVYKVDLVEEKDLAESYRDGVFKNRVLL